MSNSPCTAYVVSHTHWDREWYRTFQVFRMRLVEMTDSLLDLLDADPTFGPFYFDGQTSVIDDYLEIRPEQAGRLGTALASGRIYAGPWFIQPDEFLSSGEAHIRNLLHGSRMCRSWNTGVQIGYAPDAFGHTSQMPQILRGFDIDNAVLFRGITTDHVDSEFWWESPDGSRVLCVKMPDDNAYSNFYYRMRETLADTDTGQPINPDRVAQDARALLSDGMAERPTTSNLLWMNGVDHIFPQPRTSALLAIVNERLAGEVTAVQASLRDFVDAVLADKPTLATVTGELRVSNRAWKLQALLAHVASSRIHLKQLNAQCEMTLERWAEPFAAIAGKVAGYNAEAACRFLRHAWRQLLLNQPHDSICGCSVDQVHRDMLTRFDQCSQIAEKVTGDALRAIAESVDTDSMRHPSGEPLASLVVFNPLPWGRRDELVDTVVHLPADSPLDSVSVAGPDGLVPCRSDLMPPAHSLSQAPHDIPVGSAAKRVRVRFVASAPSVGVSTYVLVPSVGVRVANPRVTTHSDGIANENLRVSADTNGAVTVVDKRTGQSVHNAFVFESGGDFGDGYNYVKPASDTVASTASGEYAAAVKATTSADGVTASMVVMYDWYVPAGRDGDQRDSTLQAPVTIELTLTLVAGATRLDAHIRVNNMAKDHRLRVLVPTGVANATAAHAEQAFDVVERPIARPDCTGWREPQPATAPQKTFVDVSDGARGVCLANRGLPEYEVIDDAARTIALTLLRATGNGVGAPDEQHEGQMLGTTTFDISLVMHNGNWLSGRVWQTSHAFNVPMRAVQTGIHAGTIGPRHSFVEASPEHVLITAIKKGEETSDLVVRAVNLGDAGEVSLSVGNAHSLASTATLSEESREVVPMTDGCARIAARNREIVTVMFRNGA